MPSVSRPRAKVHSTMSVPPVWNATRTAYGSAWSKAISAVTGSEGLPGTTRRSSITEVTESGRMLIAGTCLFLVGCLLKDEVPRERVTPNVRTPDLFGLGQNIGIAEGCLQTCRVIRLPESGRLAQLVRALASHARGHWFKSSIAHRPDRPRPRRTGPRRLQAVQTRPITRISASATSAVT